MINFLDTSAVLNGAYTKYSNIYISPIVLMELENIKTGNKSESVKYLARQATRDILQSKEIKIIINSQDKIEKILSKFDFLMPINDHKLLCEAYLLSKKEKVTFITNDSSQYLFSKQIPNLISYFYEQASIKNDEYCGWNKYTPNESTMTALYSNLNNNILNCKINEFAEIYEGETLKDVLFWDGTKYRNLKFQNFTSILGEQIRPRNLEQKMYMDLLQNKQIPIKLCIARFGTGKSYLALNYALHEIQQGHFDKLVFVKNNLEVKGAGTLGRGCPLV